MTFTATYYMRVGDVWNWRWAPVRQFQAQFDPDNRVWIWLGDGWHLVQPQLEPDLHDQILEAVQEVEDA